ncbi:hypothetical protein pipiens_012290 [Culex pipiens pipiens]|uniref:Uncharacterized protein n=1 Tax=Culex pipiens pipiens TaxID=38569 RepID=A0ABD1D2Y4_CULPP
MRNHFRLLRKNSLWLPVNEQDVWWRSSTLCFDRFTAWTANLSGRRNRVSGEKPAAGDNIPTTYCCRGDSGVLANQQGHGKRIPHRRTSLTNLATDGTKTGGKERRSTERNTSSTTSTRAGRPESQRRTTDQLDFGSRHGTQRSPEVQLKAGAAARRYTGIGSSRLHIIGLGPNGIRAEEDAKKAPKRGLLCGVFARRGQHCTEQVAIGQHRRRTL